MIKKYILVLSIFLVGCTPTEGAQTYGPPLPDWSEQDGEGGTLWHYEVNFLGKVDTLYIYEQNTIFQAASSAHGNTRLFIVEDNKKVVSELTGYEVFGTELSGSLLTFTCGENSPEKKSDVDLSKGIPAEPVLICGDLLEFSKE